MVTKTNRKLERERRHRRVRRKISGTTECPRLCVYRSNSNIYAQIIDDVAGNTLVQASTLDKELVGQKAAEVRSKRPPEVYRGKGIKYDFEHIRRKEGKTGK